MQIYEKKTNKDEIKNLISNVRKKKLDGLNVTVPLKKKLLLI